MVRLTNRVLAYFTRFRLNQRLASFRRTVGSCLRPGLERKLLWLHEEVGLSDKRILEIGGDLEGKVAKACLALGAKHVTSINHDAEFTPRTDDRSRYLRLGAGDSELPADDFDLVIGFAVLEHIRGLEQVLDNIHRVTGPGGRVYLHGAPLWNSGKGHHVVVIGPSGQHWRFDGKPGSINPLENWEHLRRKPPELYDRLLRDGCPGPDARAIVDYVYGSDLINRYPLAYLKQCFEASRFTVLDIIESEEKDREKDAFEGLAAQLGLPAIELKTSSVEFLLGR